MRSLFGFWFQKTNCKNNSSQKNGQIWILTGIIRWYQEIVNFDNYDYGIAVI